MDDKLIPAYIVTSAALLGIPMNAAREARVAVHLKRTAAMAAMLDDFDLAAHDEIAEIYSPSGFTSSKIGSSQL